MNGQYMQACCIYMYAYNYRTGVTDVQVDSQIIENDLPDLASCFDEQDVYLYKLKLTPGQQTDVKDLAY